MNLAHSEPISSRLCILVVDDVPDNCLLLQTALELEGYKVAIADNGLAALGMIAAHPPDLLVLDVMMPVMNGFEVTHQIRQLTDMPYIPIILVTAYNEHSALEAQEAGADGFIRKPIDLGQLMHCVQVVLNSHSN